MKDYNQTPLIFAVYKRDGDNPEPDSLKLITFEDIKKDSETSYHKQYNTYLIPLDAMLPGFELQKQYSVNKW